jgi:hypothetical protein
MFFKFLSMKSVEARIREDTQPVDLGILWDLSRPSNQVKGEHGKHFGGFSIQGSGRLRNGIIPER